MKKSVQRKGSDLEQAVRAIEDSILRAAPGFAEGTFKILGNRIINVEGVRHEIDVFVTASLAPGYESIFIFECKNWDAKVGKNEIVVFSEKILAASAQRGFFVAKSYTRDAIAQAKKNDRIVLLRASHTTPAIRIQFPQFHLVNVTQTHADVEILGFNVKGTLRAIDLTAKSITIHGETTPAEEYFKGMSERARDAKLNRTPSYTLGEGEHEIIFDETLDFIEGEAFIDSKPIKAVSLRGKATVHITIASVLSVYEVESRGRMIVVGMSSAGIEVQANLVELPAPTQ
jgi:Restriction endonuclease